MKHRTLLAAGLSIFALPLDALSLRAVETAPRKPNVLFIAVDDLKPVLGCYGDTVVKSPNIDRLAARGVTFTRAYTMQAVCAPSRNAVLTGLRPESLRIYDLSTFFRTTAPDVITLPQLFKQQGWQAHAVGKLFHVGHGNHDDPVSWSVPHVQPRGNYALAANIAASGQADKKGARAGAALRNPPVEIADVPDDAYADGKTADLGIERLRGFKKSGVPFFLALGFLKPHLPFCAPKKYWDLYDRAAFRLAERATLPEGAPAFAGHNSGELRKYSDIPKVDPLTPAQARELIHGYHAAVSYMDAQVGRVLAELDRLGLRDNTIVVLWGDHGWHLGDHGLWCKHTNFEQAAHAPLLVAAPGAKNAGARSAAVVEFVDIYPTLCDLAGVAKPPHLQGTSLAPLLEYPAGSVGGTAFHVYPREVSGHGEVLGQAVRTERYRLVEWRAADRSVVARELYDYEVDPEETINLAGQPGQAATMARLSALIAARLTAPPPAGVTLRPPPAAPAAKSPARKAKTGKAP